MKKRIENLRIRIPFITEPTREMELAAVSVVRSHTSATEFPEIIDMLGLSHLINN